MRAYTGIIIIYISSAIMNNDGYEVYTNTLSVSLVISIAISLSVCGFFLRSPSCSSDTPQSDLGT